MSAVLFWVLAVGAVLAGLLVFRLDSMARVTFALLASFLFVAAEVLLLGLGYLGVVIILMMVMEMVIMAAFMVMYMMNPAGLMPMSMEHNKTGSMIIAGATFAALGAGIFLVDWPRVDHPQRTGQPPADPTLVLGEALMGRQMLTMMTLGLAIFAVIVTTVVLSTARGRYDRFGDDLDAARPDDPVPGGAGR